MVSCIYIYLGITFIVVYMNCGTGVDVKPTHKI